MQLSRELIRNVEESRQAFIRTASGLNFRQSTFAPEDKWSIAQIVEHITWADQGMMVGTFRAWEDFKSGRGLRKEDNPHHGMPLEEVIARTWDGPVKSPVMAEPKWGGPLSYWLSQLEANSEMLRAFVEMVGEADVEDMVYPHSISGPVNVHQRIEFLQFHMDHHRRQIEDIRSRADFPSD